MKVLTYIVTFVWLILGLYFGIAGWQGSKALQKTAVAKSASSTNAQSYEFEGLNFKDEESLREFLKERASSRWFPWIFSVPQDITPLIAALAFGFLGGAARLLKILSIDSKDIPPAKLFSDPFFGAIIGLTMFFLSLLLPALFTSGTNPVRPEAIAGVSLLGGFFSEEAYAWVKKQVNEKVFSSTKVKAKKQE
jgi:hypothetical protein